MDSSGAITTSAAQARLQHLLTLPESPTRRREITALERLLASGAIGSAPKRGRKASASRRMMTEADLDEAPEDETEAPREAEREVQNVGTHRRVIIRAAAKSDDEVDADEERRLARERERRRGDIQSMVGERFRGDD